MRRAPRRGLGRVLREAIHTLGLAVGTMAAVLSVALTASSVEAQVTCFGDPTCVQPITGYPIGQPGTPNIDVVSHLPLPGVPFSHTDIEIE